MSTPSPIILAGMHRSGTSMAASLLHATGIDMGERLMGADHGNTKGHFENLDFFEFHRDALQRSGLTSAGWIHDPPLSIPDDMRPRALGLLEKNAAHAAAAGKLGFGFKDPRTTLFLDFWHAVAPDARFLFIYRSPWEVADSIFRRGTDNDQFFREDPADTVRVWAHYNRLLLNFTEAHPAQSVLVANDAVVDNPNAFISLLNARFHLNLAPPPDGLVDRRIMHKEASATTHVHLILQAFPETRDLLQSLHDKSDLKAAPPPAPAQSALADSFRDWFQANQLGRDLKTCRKQFEGDAAWYKSKIQSLEAHVTAAHQQSQELAQRLDREHWEWLKERAHHALTDAESHLLTALASGPLDPHLRTQGVPVQYDPAESASVAETRVALVFPGPFRPGDHMVRIQFPALVPPGAAIEARWNDHRVVVALEPDGSARISLPREVVLLRLMLPPGMLLSGQERVESHPL